MRKINCCLSRIMTLLLTMFIGLSPTLITPGGPNPVYALRPVNVHNNVGLEEEIKDHLGVSQKSSGLEEEKLAQHWDEPTSLKMSQEIVAFYNGIIPKKLHNRYRFLSTETYPALHVDQLLPRGTVGSSKAQYGVEKWDDPEDHLYFVRVGPLFYMENSFYEQLSGDLKTKLGHNVILMENLGQSTIANPHNFSTGQFGYHTYTGVIAAAEIDLQGKRWIGLGASDGMQELAAARFRAFVDLFELDDKALQRAQSYFERNGYVEGTHFRLHHVDIRNQEEVVRQLDHMQAPIVLTISFGTWPRDEIYRQGYEVTNADGISLIGPIESALGQTVTHIILEGYLGSTPLVNKPTTFLNAFEIDHTSVTSPAYGYKGRLFISTSSVMSSKCALTFIAEKPEQHAGLEEEIRVLRIEDPGKRKQILDQLMSLRREIFGNKKEIMDSEPSRRVLFEDLLVGRIPGVLAVVFQKDRIVGFSAAAQFRGYPSFAEIIETGVLHNFQNQGLGERLTRRVLAELEVIPQFTEVVFADYSEGAKSSRIGMRLGFIPMGPAYPKFFIKTRPFTAGLEEILAQIGTVLQVPTAVVQAGLEELRSIEKQTKQAA